MAKIDNYRKYSKNKIINEIESIENLRIPSRPPNLFEYLINRDKALNLGDIQAIAKDLIMSLQ